MDRKEEIQISPMDWATWKHHPVTKYLHKFLAEYREALKQEGWGLLEAGRVDPHLLGELAGRAKTLVELVDLELSHIQDFYKEEDNVH